MFWEGLLSAIIAFTPTYEWPTKEWTVAVPADVGINADELERALNYCFPDNINWKSRVGIRTEGLLIVKDGLLIYEKYSRGYSAEKRHAAWSVTKMLINTLMGIATKQKRLSLEDPVSKFIHSRGREKEFEALKIKDLMFWSSGFDWHETYEYNPLRSSVIALLYGEGQANMEKFILDFPFSHPPGTRFNYSSGDSNLLSAILKKALDAEYENYPWKEVFEPLGMSSAVLEVDAKGLFVGSSFMHLTARDLAKLGLLYLNDGRWQSREILPRGWVFDSLKIAPAYVQTRKNRNQMSPGKHLWVNSEDPARNIKRPLSGVGPDLYGAYGHWGQALWILPSARMVVVRFADDRDGSFDENTFWGLLMNALSTPSNLRVTSTP